MNINVDKNDFYTLLSVEKSDEKNISHFYTDVKEKYLNFKDDNLILDFSNIASIDLEEILLFSNINDKHKKNGKSFVLVCKGIDVDELPEDLISVPTLNEAVDVVEMEEIERDLGI